MKKTLIALSLAALSTAAVADVTLYGQIKAGVEVGQTKVRTDGVTTKGTTTTNIADFGSRIGFKGHENLGNGLNAIWKVEQKTSVAGNSTGWGNRVAYIGLESQAGTVRAGRIGNQLDDMGKVDPWTYSNSALGLDKFTRTGDKVLSVRYDSPVVAGFSGNVQYSPRDNDTTGAAAAGLVTRGSDAYYAGLNYENAGFFGQYGFGYKKYAGTDLNNRLTDGQVHRVEAGYDANNIFAAVGYQYTDSWTKNNSAEFYPRKTHEVAVTGAYTLGNVVPKISYAHGFKSKGDLPNDQKSQDTYNQVVAGVDYNFSKRTTAFAQAGWLRENGRGGRTTTGGAEANANTYTAGSTRTTTAGLVGLVHKF